MSHKQKKNFKFYTKLPLYLGLSVFILSVIISGVKVGKENLAYLSQRTNATVDGAALTLRFTVPNLVSVALNSQKEVAGVDVVIKYDKNSYTIYPSTLRGNELFITSGGSIDEYNGTFTFNALSRGKVLSGVVATFNISPKTGRNIDTNMDIATGTGKSAVIESGTSQNILSNTSGIKFSLAPK